MDQLIGILSGGQQLEGELNIPKVLGELGRIVITENGTYEAADEGYDGFSRVKVSVADSVQITMSDCTFTDAGDGNIVITEE